MTTYETLLWLHISFATLWVGGNVLLNLLALKAQAAGDDAEMETLLKQMHFLGLRFFFPVSVITLIFGIWLVAETPYTFDEPWIMWSLVMYALSTVAGMGFLGPQSGPTMLAVAADGLAAPAVRSKLSRYLLVARLDAALTLAVVFLMAAKPGV